MAGHSNLHGKPKCLSTETYGLCIIGLSALLYSVMGAFVKLATQSGLPSTEIVFIRALFQGSLVTAASLCFREAPSSEKHDNNQLETTRPKLIIQSPLGNASIRHVVIARGACGGCGFVLYYFTISALPLGDAVALLSLSPVVTVWASAAFAGQPIRPLHALSAVTTVLGTFLIARPDFIFGPATEQTSHPPRDSLGYVTALLGTCTGAGVFLLMRKAGKVGAHTLQLLFSWVLFGLIFSSLLGVALPAIFGQTLSWALPPSKAVWGFLLGCCCFGTVAHFLLNFAARHSNPGLASIVRSSGILWAYAMIIRSAV
jgi:drug/metabolite transporter (DMT)-like permease